ncbi:MAG TPA: recombinase family protein [Actinomycetes bacterium]|jgi:DNA invertase Pin-like site-specific DNA recombinase
MQTAIYARISKDDQGEAENVEIQVDECQEYAAQQGWQVVEVFDQDNDISASSGKYRPGYEALKASILAGEVECILVTEMTRLNRKLWYSIDLFRLAESTPLRRIATTDGGGYDLSTRQGIHNAIMAAIEAEKESMRLAERIQRKKRKQAKDGVYNGGPRPFGYDYIPAVREGGKVVEPGRLVPDEREAGIANDAAQWMLQGRSIRSVVIELNEAGRTRGEGRVWWPTTLRDVLNNPRIAGFRSHNGKLYKASWPAIVDADTWERLQLVLRAEERFKSPARIYLLTGWVFCGNCGEPAPDGEPVNPGAPLVGYGSYDRSGVSYRRYYCLPADNRGMKRGCGKVSRLADPVDLLVSEAVLDVLDSPRVAELLATAAESQETAELVERYRTHKLKLDDLVADYASGLLNREQLAHAKSVVEEAMEQTKAKLDRLASTRAMAAIPVDTSLREVWKTADVHWRRQLIGLVVDKVILYPSRPGGRRWPNPQGDEWEAELAERIDQQWRFDPAAVEIRWKV